jgi:hypothetical protein
MEHRYIEKACTVGVCAGDGEGVGAVCGHWRIHIS